MARNKPKTVLAALACVSLAALTGCAGQADYATEPFIGFEPVGSIDETYDVYYDKGTESGMHDVIIAEGDHRVLSCLGEPVLICYDGDKSGEGELIIVIAEEGTETTILDYNGEEIEMQKTETPADIESPAPVFVTQAPVLEDREGFSWSWRGLDANGEELWTK
ncbi:hypothetical protein [Agrococcus casei]|uniref:Lipoprotein n=1 Tax=Agrococcus casei LMG 22410 TaxID=1255656 RepID=A0A1R4F4B1_9MICO|nr:hypothetical protein [Agrococcus casei]SJM50759.1 hypothetical protein CZ674_02490 [Agrococcus casei LMG 22410]